MATGSMISIRMATAGDAWAIAEIYRPFCEVMATSFETTAPSADEMAARIRVVTEQFPWVVLDDDGVVAGYAYATRHRERAAYAWSAESTVYVASTHRRRGAATALYSTLFEILRRQGYYKVYAGITLPNPGSVTLHEHLGFTRVGVYSGVGYKQGTWHDVAHVQLALRDEDTEPWSPRSVSSVVDTSEWTAAVAHGLRHYRR
jgi:phosphinothricin acetyltransferase